MSAAVRAPAMTANQQYWWTLTDAMCSRREREDGLRGGVLVVGIDAYDAARAHPKRCDQDGDVVSGPWGHFELILGIRFSPWHALIMDDLALVPDSWNEIE